jgi:hypothetical protein
LWRKRAEPTMRHDCPAKDLLAQFWRMEKEAE